METEVSATIKEEMKTAGDALGPVKRAVQNRAHLTESVKALLLRAYAPSGQ